MKSLRLRLRTARRLIFSELLEVSAPFFFHFLPLFRDFSERELEAALSAGGARTQEFHLVVNSISVHAQDQGGVGEAQRVVVGRPRRLGR